MPAAPAIGDRIAPFALPLHPSGIRRWQPGRVTVFSFCAFWCDTWKEQNERLAATGAALAGLPVEYLTISVDGRWAERGAPIRTPVLLDPGGAISRRWNIDAVPYTLIVDRRGIVRHAARGITRADDLRQTLRALLNGAPETTPGTLYLTFDDFPAASGDDDLLDILRRADIRATLFCIGRRLAAARPIVRRAHDEGHVLQIHSWDHDAADPEIDRCSRALREIAGVRPTLYRPPGSDRLLRVPGATGTVATGAVAPETGATVNPYDYARPGETEILRRVLHAAKPGSVLLLHAGVEQTRRALPEMIGSLKRRGMGFGTLG